jgi:Mg-chelatase subunit ChlD
MANDEKIEATGNKLAKRSAIFAGKKVGLAAKVAEAGQNSNPLEMTNRIGLVFDDSGSMGGEPLAKAKEAVDAFIKSCNPFDTSLALYLFGPDASNRPLTTDLVILNMYVQGLDAPNGTPLYGTLDKLINKEPVTRAVVFSDGSPTDEHKESDGAKRILEQYKAKGVVADTVFIGHATDSYGASELQWIAEYTGGVFLQFKDAATFAKNFKYLAPKFRAMLSDKSFVDEITKK